MRVRDALKDLASLRDIAAALFDEAQVARDWRGRSDFLRSRVRRLVHDAKMLARGGYRLLLSSPRRHRPPGAADDARDEE